MEFECKYYEPVDRALIGGINGFTYQKPTKISCFTCIYRQIIMLENGQEMELCGRLYC